MGLLSKPQFAATWADWPSRERSTMQAQRADSGTAKYQPDLPLLPVGTVDAAGFSDFAVHGRGYAGPLHDHLFETASRTGHRRVVCEVLRGGSKTIRYLSQGLHPVPVT
jgi:hypothetical protein